MGMKCVHNQTLQLQWFHVLVNVSLVTVLTAMFVIFITSLANQVIILLALVCLFVDNITQKVILVNALG